MKKEITAFCLKLLGVACALGIFLFAVTHHSPGGYDRSVQDSLDQASRSSAALNEQAN